MQGPGLTEFPLREPRRLPSTFLQQLLLWYCFCWKSWKICSSYMKSCPWHPSLKPSFRGIDPLATMIRGSFSLWRCDPMCQISRSPLRQLAWGRVMPLSLLCPVVSFWITWLQKVRSDRDGHIRSCEHGWVRRDISLLHCCYMGFGLCHFFAPLLWFWSWRS